VATVNANGKYLAGVRVEEKEREILRNNPQKSSYFNLIYEAKLPRALFIIDTEKGTLKEIHTDSAWLNHVQFSTTDPDLLMFCHEGPWHKVDRIWTIRLSTQQTMLMHKRTMPNEIAGHEWSSPDGKTIWFDLQQPRSTTFFVAGADVKTGKEIKYSLKREEWSIHYHLSNNQQLFCGDGADPGQVARAKNAQWIYLFRPNGDHFDAEKLVDMKHHGYKLEPNVHFSPDDKWVIFRANFEGIENVYAVEILPAVQSLSMPTNGWPAITQTMKPWTRWWWQGSAVNGKDLDWNLEQFQQAGLGGVLALRIIAAGVVRRLFISQWLTCSTGGEFFLDDLEFRIAVCLRTGVIPYVFDTEGPPIPCASAGKSRNAVCNAVDMRSDWFHRIHCIFENKIGRDRMHNRILAKLLQLADRCLLVAHREPKGYNTIDEQGRSTDKKRPDGIIYFADNQHGTLFDVATVDPIGKTALQRTVQNSISKKFGLELTFLILI
jgi:hypothetical protein